MIDLSGVTFGQSKPDEFSQFTRLAFDFSFYMYISYTILVQSMIYLDVEIEDSPNSSMC